MQESKSPSTKPSERPRIGLPYRSAGEERAENWAAIEPYAKAVEEAGGTPRLISLLTPEAELARIAQDLDGVLLPGSSVDVDPARYQEEASPETGEADPYRERTDLALLDWAFQSRKPVLTICYGTQLLNVYRGGTLVQDIRSELRSSLAHRWEKGSSEPYHPVRLVPGSLVADLAETVETVVNSSHHQSIRRAGRGLRLTAKSPDGVVEAVELESKDHWVVGVQWHPERQKSRAGEGFDSGFRLARALFRDLVRAAREARGHSRSEPEAAQISKHSEGR